MDSGDDGKEKASGKTAQKNTCEAFCGPKHPPLFGQDDVTIANSCIAGAGKIESRLEIR
jgi:hypothetical protein